MTEIYLLTSILLAIICAGNGIKQLVDIQLASTKIDNELTSTDIKYYKILAWVQIVLAFLLVWSNKL